MAEVKEHWASIETLTKVQAHLASIRLIAGVFEHWASIETLTKVQAHLAIIVTHNWAIDSFLKSHNAKL